MFKNSLLSIFAAYGLTLIVLAAAANDDSAKTDTASAYAVSTEPTTTSAVSATPETKRDPTPLAIEPGTAPSTIVIPPGRPNWVESPADRKSEVHKIAVSSGPHAQRRDCVELLDIELAKTVADYIEEYLGVGGASRLVHYDLKTIKTRLVGADQYEETIEVSIGPMQQVHALVKFDPQFRADLDQRWHEIKATSRLLQSGLFGGAVLGFLGLVFGYLKLDTATRGYYTGRLQFAAVAAILGLAAAGVFLARWIPWM